MSSARLMTRAARVPGRRLQLVEGDHRPGLGVDDLAAHAEIVQHPLQRARGLGQTRPVEIDVAALARLREELERRQLEPGIRHQLGNRPPPGWRRRSRAAAVDARATRGPRRRAAGSDDALGLPAAAWTGRGATPGRRGDAPRLPRSGAAAEQTCR